jgi:AcrR family transcriptional regulator
MTTVRGKEQRGTPEQILETAERLFAQRGISAVSSRLVAQEAGALNNSAVGYHFGTKEDLVVATLRRHYAQMESWWAARAVALAGTRDPHGFIDALVRQLPEHLEACGPQSYFARFLSATMTDPAWRHVMVEESLKLTSLPSLRKGLRASDLPIGTDLLDVRASLVAPLVTHACAEEEAARAGGCGRFPSWEALGDFLVDAVAGLLLAPVTPGRYSG